MNHARRKKNKNDYMKKTPLIYNWRIVRCSMYIIGLDVYKNSGYYSMIDDSTSGIFAYEYLDERRIEVHLAHPTLVKPFAKKHVKTDKVDSEVLAQLLRMDYLPESYVPEGEIRDLRTIVRHRASLVRLRTSIKNRVHALLTREGIELPKLSDIFGKRGTEFLKGVKLQQQRRTVLDDYLRVLEVLNCVIKEVEETLEEKG